MWNEMADTTIDSFAGPAVEFYDPIVENDHVKLTGMIYSRFNTGLSQRGENWVESENGLPVDVSFDINFYNNGEIEFVVYKEKNEPMSFMGGISYWRAENPLKKSTWDEKKQELVDAPQLIKIARDQLIEHLRGNEEPENLDGLLEILQEVAQLAHNQIEYTILPKPFNPGDPSTYPADSSRIRIGSKKPKKEKSNVIRFPLSH